VNSFGNWVKRRRKALDLTQPELAHRVGCSLATIVKIEADQRRPSFQIAALLAEHLEIQAAERDVFIKVARQEKGDDHLETLSSYFDTASLSMPKPAAHTSQSTAFTPKPPQKSTLPIPLTPLIGREHETQTVIQQLQDPACRLLTLTGSGGVGKTRLSLEVAYRTYANFEHGVYFVSLVGTGAAEFIVPAIADGLGFTFSGATELKGQLFNHLKDKQVLLVLDNLEHLLAGVQLLDELLEHAPRLKVLATSREQLNLRAEWLFEVQGLPVSPHIDLHNLEANSAAALFIQRAKHSNINFVPLPENLPAIAHICQLVEGLPLALELAASWVRVMSMNEIVHEIERSLDFLSTTARDTPQRHRSIRAVFDYSWNLLSLDERRALRWLSVFRGGFTRAAAEQVAGATLPLISALVDKSLVRRSVASTGRYDLHELLRQYAATRLQLDQQEEGEARRRHAEFYLALLGDYQSRLQSQHQREALVRINPETDNIRFAWEEAILNQRLDLLRAAVWSLWYVYELRTYFQEGEMLIKRSVELTRGWLAKLEVGGLGLERTNIQGALGAFLAHQAFFSFRLGRNIESQQLFEESISLLRNLNESTSLAYALGHYGILRSLQGAYEEAVLNTSEAIELSRASRDRWQEALYTTFLGMATDDQGKYDDAFRLFTEALQICRELGDPRLISLAAGYLGQTAHTLGRYDEVPNLLREGLQASAETNDRFGIALAGVRMAMVAQTRGKSLEARRHLKESIQHFREAGDTWFLAHALNFEGKIAFAAGEYEQAEERFREAGKLAFATQAFPMLLDAMLGLATLDTEKGSAERALLLALHIVKNPAGTHDTKQRSKKLRDGLLERLSEAQIATVNMQFQHKSFEALVHEFLLISRQS